MTFNFNRRTFLSSLACSAAAGAVAGCGSDEAQARAFPVRHTDAEWRRLLTPAQYNVLRQDGTERPYTSPLLQEKRRGTYQCVADGHPLFASTTKFESGTGWPSFFRPLPGAMGTKTDFKTGYPRTALHCQQCGGHLGHVFDDGPRPTGKRYCMNGVAMRFVPA